MRLSRAIADAKHQKIEQEVRRHRLLNDEREGRLCRRDEVEEYMRLALVDLRDLLLAWPAQLGGSFAPEVRAVVVSETSRHVRDLLAMMRRKLERIAVDAKA